MIWVCFVVAFGKFIEKSLDLNSIQLVTSFVGHDIKIKASCRLEEESSRSALQRANLDFFISNTTNVTCDRNYVKRTKIELPAEATWGEDAKIDFSAQGNIKYFWLADCNRILEDGQSSRIRIEITDSVSGQYSSETDFLQLTYQSILLFHLIFICANIYQIYSEKNEELPFVLLFISSILFILSNLLDYLVYYIYSFDGLSYKFILVFSQFFSVSGAVSLLGIMLLIATGRFDPKDLLIEDSEFLGFISMVSCEFLVEILLIFRNEVLGCLDLYSTTNIFIIFSGRAILLMLCIHYLKGKQGVRLEGFRQIERIITLCLFFPLITYLLSMTLQHHSFCTIVTFSKSLPIIISQLYLFKKFAKFNIIGILPFKSHNF